MIRPMHLDERFLSLHDFELAARRRLPRGLFGFVAGGSADGWSAANNRAAFDRWAFVPRTLEAGPTRGQEITLLGQRFASPCGIEMVPLGHFELPGVHVAQAVFGLPDEVSRLGHDGA